MQENREISALFTLIDDPDEEVFCTVSNKIVEYGKGIIPNLENLWENTVSEDVQTRIEMLIHRLHYTDLLHDLGEWRNSPYNDLLFGALLVSKFQYPDLQTTPVLQEIEKIRRNVWLEMNSYLTPLEQANVISSIVYNYYNLKGAEVGYTNPDDFFIHKVIQSKKGNTITNGILYLILAELLDMPVRAINIPRQFVLAFFQPDYDPANFKGNPQTKINFYVDATTGQPFTQKDIELYFKRISVPPTVSYFKPLSHIRIIQL
ncbi:MAG TPA: transglutaminase-like domain-containing protein, partial [Chitinophagaceae bacterium]|nr:transglutaminase-like domain-containing protein [Chitinophagaceae bacterium]